MLPNVRHIITKGTECGTLQVGDHVYLMTDGTLLCKEAGGWLTVEEVESILPQVKMVIDREWMDIVLAQTESMKNRIKEIVNAPS